MTEVKPIKSQLAKITRKIECPRCHSLEFNYVEYKNGQKLIVSPCGWELCYIEGPRENQITVTERIKNDRHKENPYLGIRGILGY